MNNSKSNLYLFYATDQTNILLPIRNSLRVKYTCFHVSESYLAFGSSSGGVYLFHKLQNNTFQYLLTILNDCGAISCVAFSHSDENMLAIATNKGHLIIVVLKSDDGLMCCPYSWNIIYQCSNFADKSISLLQWDVYSDYRLYMTDESGNIFVLHNINSMTNLMILPLPSILLKTSSKIFQFDISEDLLLISAHNKCCLYDLRDASLTQIGTKSRSNGHYGVCFFPSNHTQSKCIFTSRPHSRLWHVDMKGSVQFTHQFRESLINQTELSIINGDNNYNYNSEKKLNDETLSDKVSSSVSFGKFCLMYASNTFLITYSNAPQTCIYVIDPINAKIVCWCRFNANRIYDIYCVDHHIYLSYTVTADTKLRFCHLSLLTLDQCLSQFYETNDLLSAANLVINNIKYFGDYSANNTNGMIEILKNIWSNLNDKDRQIFKEMETLIDRKSVRLLECESRAQNTVQMNGRWNDNSCDDYTSSESESDYSITRSNHNLNHNELFAGIETQYTNADTDIDIDVFDKGFTELKKLKHIVLSKLNNTAIIANLNVLPNHDSNKNIHSESAQLENGKHDNNMTQIEECIETDTKTNPTVIFDDLKNQLIASNHMNECKCKCGAALPSSHLNQSEIQLKMQQIITESLAQNHTISELIEISYNYCLWPLFIRLLLTEQLYDEYIVNCLMLCDISLLNRDQLRNYLSNKKNFRELIANFVKQRATINSEEKTLLCIKCNDSVNCGEMSATDLLWEQIMHLSIKSVGVQETMLTLTLLDCDRKPRFSIEFYLLLLRMLMISVFESPITHKKLDKLRSYLNSISSGEHSPALSQRVSSDSSDANHDNTGYKINLSNTNCQKCEKRLNVLPNIGENIIAFKCKHFYHKSCNTQRFCLVCK